MSLTAKPVSPRNAGSKLPSLQASMLAVAFLALYSFKLSFEFMHRGVYAFVGVLAALGDDENLVVLGAGYYLHFRIAAGVAFDDYFHLVDTVVKSRKLGSFFLRVAFNGVGYSDMFSANSKKQGPSP